MKLWKPCILIFDLPEMDMFLYFGGLKLAQ